MAPIGNQNPTNQTNKKEKGMAKWHDGWLYFAFACINNHIVSLVTLANGSFLFFFTESSHSHSPPSLFFSDNNVKWYNNNGLN
jgi:hypothetical protein